jgi:fatty acid desaturase
MGLAKHLLHTIQSAHNGNLKQFMRIPLVQKIEWPTIALIIAVYLVLGLLVRFHAELPWWVILPIGAYTACLHSSLQHEVLHGHPTRVRWINELLVFIVPHLWLPFGRYRDTHLAHHNDLNLTCPVQDPESFYLLPEVWNALPGAKRALYQFNNTLFGRMLIGPAVGLLRFWAGEVMLLAHGQRSILKCWSAYFVSTILVLTFVQLCGMPVWQYIVLIAYPAISLALVRSFCEHQAVEEVGGRTIVVEASRFWSLLFLNNNLHIAHHDRPTLPWYQLPQYYQMQRAAFLQKNNNYLMQGYGEIFRRYFFVGKETVYHPNLEWLGSKKV